MMSKKVITPAPEDFCKAIERFKKSVEEATELFNNIVTVVRCKDCWKRGSYYDCPCHENGRDEDDDWFCADGERKETI